MTRDTEKQTLMYREAREASARIRRQLTSNKQQMERLAKHLRGKPPSLIMTCARGSSDHAATYAKYLIETHIGIPTLSAAPSIDSVFAARKKSDGQNSDGQNSDGQNSDGQNSDGHNLDDVLFLAISQSGQSPDILSAARAAKDRGAFLLSLVNNAASPLAKLSDMVIPLHAGPEKSVAATKSFICSLGALVHLVAAWSQNESLMKELYTLPDALEKAFALDWHRGLDLLKEAGSLFVISRGFGLGIAQEAALKLKETCGLHAEAFSAAEVKHGPMTIVKKGFPLLIFSLQDQTQPSIDDAAMAFIERGAVVLAAGQSYDGAHNLDMAYSAAPELRPVVFIQSFYKFVNALSLARGYNPDCPPYLNKVTETL